MTNLSAIALIQATPIIEEIKLHPFNIELGLGTLDCSRFAYYIEQDTLYLRDFSRSLAMIAARARLKWVKDFLSFSEGALIAEQEAVHHFFQKTFQLQETGFLTPATFSYTNYLLQTSTNAPIEIAIAAILPCFWIYRIIGQSIAENTNNTVQNPYFKWIETYSSQEFSNNVERAIQIFDEAAMDASDKIRQSMLDAFYKSSVLEWYFWNDSYNKTIFEVPLKG